MVIKVVRFILVWIIYPLYNMFRETFYRKRCIIVSSSVKPFRNNWGDYVSVILCSLVNPHKKYIPRYYTWNIYGKDDILCIGSIITWMTTPNSLIWGSGIVYPEREISAIPQKVFAVRGPLTRDYLMKRGIECPEIYGDPALLFPRYYQPNTCKKYKLGIIPHFRDKQNLVLERFGKNKDVLIIDVAKVHPWTKFIDEIYSCECIASSSLHGIIVSDAYEVPNVWVEFEGGERKDFAFRDYYGSVGKTGQSSYPMNKEVTKDLIVAKCNDWKPINIDLDRLLSVCPFKK